MNLYPTSTSIIHISPPQPQIQAPVDSWRFPSACPNGDTWSTLPPNSELTSHTCPPLPGPPLIVMNPCHLSSCLGQPMPLLPPCPLRLMQALNPSLLHCCVDLQSGLHIPELCSPFSSSQQRLAVIRMRLQGPSVNQMKPRQSTDSSWGTWSHLPLWPHISAHAMASLLLFRLKCPSLSSSHPDKGISHTLIPGLLCIRLPRNSHAVHFHFFVSFPCETRTSILIPWLIH